VAKAKNNPKPAKRQRQAKVVAAHESTKEFAEKRAADWAKFNPNLVERLKRLVQPGEAARAELAAARLVQPDEAELAARAELAAARKWMGRYIAIRDGQIPPPWLENHKLEGLLKPQETSGPAVEAAGPKLALNKEALARQIIEELYGRPPHEIQKDQAKTGTVRTRVNAELIKRDKDAERFSWDTINRALDRDSRRKK
jgi:hypothetical protein